jgi:hypothetical protein
MNFRLSRDKFSSENFSRFAAFVPDFVRQSRLRRDQAGFARANAACRNGIVSNQLRSAPEALQISNMFKIFTSEFYTYPVMN